MELVRKAKEGDEEAFAALCRTYKNMIYKIIYTFDLDSGDYTMDLDDLYQEGCLALYDAVFTYEEERNVLFSTFAYIVIRSRIRSYIRRQRRIVYENMYSLDLHSHESELCVREDPVTYHKELCFQQDLNKFFSELPKLDKQILVLRGDDCSYKEIAQRLDMSVKMVDNRLMKLRKRLKEEVVN